MKNVYAVFGKRLDSTYRVWLFVTHVPMQTTLTVCELVWLLGLAARLALRPARTNLIQVRTKAHQPPL